MFGRGEAEIRPILMSESGLWFEDEEFEVLKLVKR
jgi:hypothetical protein